MYRPVRPGSPDGGGAATTGGSAVIPPALTSLLALLVRRYRGGLQLLLDAADVARALQALLEEPPLTLTVRAAERRRLLVRHVEYDRLRAGDRGLVCLVDRVGVDRRAELVVARGESADLRPRRRRRGGAEELHERLDCRSVAERDEQVAA